MMPLLSAVVEVGITMAIDFRVGQEPDLTSIRFLVESGGRIKSELLLGRDCGGSEGARIVLSTPTQILRWLGIF